VLVFVVMKINTQGGGTTPIIAAKVFAHFDSSGWMRRYRDRFLSHRAL
jgi:hypothetical protein